MLPEVTQQLLTQQMTRSGNVDEEKVGDNQERWAEGQRKNSSKRGGVTTELHFRSCGGELLTEALKPLITQAKAKKLECAFVRAGMLI